MWNDEGERLCRTIKENDYVERLVGTTMWNDEGERLCRTTSGNNYVEQKNKKQLTEVNCNQLKPVTTTT